MVEWTVTVCGSYPSRAKLIVKSAAVPMVMVQGVRQTPPSDDRASALTGFDCISSTVVSGFGFNESKPDIELQAAIARPHITRPKARSSLISAVQRNRIVASASGHAIGGLTPIRARTGCGRVAINRYDFSNHESLKTHRPRRACGEARRRLLIGC
jgi:hypothetical protein